MNVLTLIDAAAVLTILLIVVVGLVYEVLNAPRDERSQNDREAQDAYAAIKRIGEPTERNR